MPQSRVDVIVWSPNLGGAIDMALEVLNGAQRRFEFVRRSPRKVLPAPKAGVHTWAKLERLLGSEKRAHGSVYVFGVLDQPIEANWYSRTLHKARLSYITTADWEFLSPLPVSAYIAYQIVENLAEMVLGRLHFHGETQGCVFDFCEMKPEISFKMRTGDICPDCVALMRSAVDRETLDAFVEMLEGTRRLALGRIVRKARDERTRAETIDMLYPFPIAHCYRSMTGESIHSRKWKKLLDVVEVSLKYACFVLLANLLEEGNPARLTLNLRRATMGNWRAALSSLLQANRELPGRTFLDDFLRSITDRQMKDLHAATQDLLRKRNNDVHGHPGDEHVYDALCAGARLPLETFMSFLEPLSRYRLLKPDEMTVLRGRRTFPAKILMGSHPDFAVERMSTRADVETACVLQHPVEDSFLSMDRWLTHDNCHECRRQMVFLFDTMSDDLVWMREYPTNHKVGRADLYLELVDVVGGRARNGAARGTPAAR